MYPFDSGGLGRNIAIAQRVRDQRFASLANGGSDGRMVGGPLPDPNWDAFFGALQDQQQAANDAGLKFKVGLGGFGNLPPSLLALTKPEAMDAARGGYTVQGDDKTGYARQFGPRRLGY